MFFFLIIEFLVNISGPSCHFKDKSILCCCLVPHRCLWLFMTYLWGHLFKSVSLHLPFVLPSDFLPPPLPSSGGPGGDSAWWRERSDLQGVLAVGVRGQSSDVAGCSVRSPQRGPRRLCSGSGRHHAASAFHEVPTEPPPSDLPRLSAEILHFIFNLTVIPSFPAASSWTNKTQLCSSFVYPGFFAVKLINLDILSFVVNFYICWLQTSS